jgi:putative transposase
MLPGIPVHVVHRGNNRQACFHQDGDRSFYLFHLFRFLPASQCGLHAYCLMTNHVHLLLTPATASSCALLMKSVSQLHTQYMNRHYRRSGSLWEGRFRSCLVQSEKYLLACYRYIELNPVRAGLAMHARDYSWSSYSVNSGVSAGRWVTPHEEYLRLGPGDAERQEAYRGLVASGLDERQLREIRAATNGNFALGDRRFGQQMSAMLGRRAQRGVPGRPAKPGAEKGWEQSDLLATSKENVVCP